MEAIVDGMMALAEPAICPLIGCFLKTLRALMIHVAFYGKFEHLRIFEAEDQPRRTTKLLGSISRCSHVPGQPEVV